MKVDFCVVRFENKELNPRMAEKLRGYFAEQYREEEIFHNHKDEKFMFRYPLVQYKVVKEIPMIIGINEGAKRVQSLGMVTDELVLEGKKHEVFQKTVETKRKEITTLEEYRHYKFETPWIALNQKNIRKYRNASPWEKEEILKKILIGNILSLAKGLNYEVKEEIHCWLNIKACEVNMKNIAMQGFKGTFKTNVVLPDYLGIGKSVAKGFGTIKEVS
ncbi:CRISPR-associated endonuclease Cas6 [Isachenkonia alkalipeptolytica]|uniref:DNA repair protein n=1 Tax=Isachenkonia alkalipeptolytica TaxID=2565777 RepID=A0AA43XIU7_9CLOT|nr:CRISPR-associated endonuclease Cas6 [Isachenkonia alkalipeptolytica]NBG87367.1 DNA repair protein [Isachenkonia alkalipeptolytica]